MPQHDLHHDAVKNALVKDGWTVTHDPFTIKLDDLKLYVDLAAEKSVTVTNPLQKVAIEIKVFGGLSFITEFEKAVGQYQIYRQFLEELFPERILYLAVALSAFEESFQLPSIQAIVRKQEIRLLVFNAETEEVLQWIK